MTSPTNRDYVQIVLFGISAMMVILICLFSALRTRKRLRAWESLSFDCISHSGMRPLFIEISLPIPFYCCGSLFLSGFSLTVFFLLQLMFRRFTQITCAIPTPRHQILAATCEILKSLEIATLATPFFIHTIFAVTSRAAKDSNHSHAQRHTEEVKRTLPGICHRSIDQLWAVHKCCKKIAGVIARVGQFLVGTLPSTQNFVGQNRAQSDQNIYNYTYQHAAPWRANTGQLGFNRIKHDGTPFYWIKPPCYNTDSQHVACRGHLTADDMLVRPGSACPRAIGPSLSALLVGNFLSHLPSWFHFVLRFRSFFEIKLNSAQYLVVKRPSIIFGTLLQRRMKLIIRETKVNIFHNPIIDPLRGIVNRRGV